jgi:hypothetical protein
MVRIIFDFFSLCGKQQGIKSKQEQYFFQTGRVEGSELLTGMSQK